MNKLNYLLLGAAGLLLASCSNDDLVLSNTGESNVSFNVSLAQDKFTRSFDDSYAATDLHYAVYEQLSDGIKKVKEEGKATFSENASSLNISLTLTNGNTYNIVFFAQSPDAPYTVTFGDNGASLKADFTSAFANSKVLDAFYKNEILTVNGSLNKTVSLTRPLTQINVGTNDWDEADPKPVKSTVAFSNVYTEMDLISGNVTGDASTVLLNMTELPGDEENFPVVSDNPEKPYKYLAMGYFLVDATPSVGDVTYSFELGNGNKVERTIQNVPVQRNHRTNLFGSLLTSNMNVTVEKGPMGDDNDYDVDNGEAKLPSSVSYDHQTNTIKALNVDGLIWLSKVTNNGQQGLYKELDPDGKKPNDYNFTVYELVKDAVYDMSGVDWTPIKVFGTFNGNNATIKNLTVKAEDGNPASFLDGQSSIISNLNFENVNLQGHYKVATVTVDGYAKIYNCHVVGGTLVSTPWYKNDPSDGPGYNDANNVGGIAAFWQGDANTKVISGCSVKDLTITAYRKVGGIIGYISKPSSNTLDDCRVENTTVIADMRDTRYVNYKDRKPQAGKIAGNEDEFELPSSVTYDDQTTLTVLSPLIGVDGTDYGTLQEALDAIASKGEGTLNLGYAEYNASKIDWPLNTNISIVGVGPESAITDLNYEKGDNNNLSFENLTLCVAKGGSATSLGFKGAESISMKDVTIKGEYHTFDAQNVTFKNCTFNFDEVNTSARQGLWIDGYGKTVVEDCVFQVIPPVGKETKAILIYSTTNTEMGDVDVINCQFLKGNVSEKAAIEIHSELFTKAGTLTITNCKWDQDTYKGGLYREIVNTPTSPNGSEGQPTNFYTVILDGKTVQPTK